MDRTPAAALMRPAFAGLAMPTLAGVPARLQLDGKREGRCAGLALHLLAAGLIADADLRAPWQHEVELLERALSRWAEPRLAPLQVFDLAFYITDDATEYCEYVGIETEEPDLVQTAIGANRVRAYTLAGNTLALDEHEKGLAETALHALAIGCGNTMPTLAPWSVVENAEMLYNWGFDEEESSYPAAEFFTHLPEWVCNPRRRVKPHRLAHLARGRGGRNVVANVAAAILEVERLAKDRRVIRAEVHHIGCLSVGVALHWEEPRTLARFYDDWVQYNANAEHTEDLGQAIFAARAIGRWLDGTARMLELARAIERLILLLGTPLAEAS